MSGTYSGAYTTTKYPPECTPTKKTKEIYTVVSAAHIDTYHYHGSWFEYTWEMILTDLNGNRIIKKLDTWDTYHKLSGKVIEYDGSVFRVIEKGANI